MKTSHGKRAGWRLRCALDPRRVRLLLDIPLEVHDGKPSNAAESSAAAGSATAADRGGHDPHDARGRSASAQAGPVSDDGGPQGSPSARPDDPVDYRLEHEPIPADAPVDYRYQFDLMRDRVEREEDRGKSLDGKTANLIAGIVASIGFSLRVSGSALSNFAAMLYIVPLITLFLTFRTHQLREAPTAESILRFFPTFPVTTLREGCQAMMNAITENRLINDSKAKLFDLAVLFTVIATTIVLGVQVALAVQKGDYFVVRSDSVAVSPAAGGAGASTSSANGSGHDRLRAKGCPNGQTSKVTAGSASRGPTP